MDQAGNVRKKKILVAPLDWGLGHATRCIPVVRSLRNQGASVVLAGEGAVKSLLQAEFPEIPFVDLPGYRVEYAKSRWTFPFVILSQIPKILSVIQQENDELREIVEIQGIDGVISDNRYGMYHTGIPSVIMTHQLLIKTGMGNWADDMLQRLHYELLQKFRECWIPDMETAPSLAGSLSHPQKLPAIPAYYVGPLSRMKSGEQKEEKLLVLLSGPEPQRTLLEMIFIRELEQYPQKAVLVRGLPNGGEPINFTSHIEVYDHLPADSLNTQMLEAQMIIARSGYSTVMDIAALKKKSILIPTSGQTEQQYLANHLMEHRLALCVQQEKFRLRAALSLAEHFPFAEWPECESSLDENINRFLNSLG